MSIERKAIKKELKEIQKRIKKNPQPHLAVIGYYILLAAGEEKEAENFLKETRKKIKGLDYESLKEKAKKAVKNSIFHLTGIEELTTKIMKKIESKEIDKEFKELFKELPSNIFKAFLAKEFVPFLLEKGDVDEALFFLNQVESTQLPFIQFLLGWAYEQKGIVGSAKSYYEKAAKQLQEAKERLAKLYVKQGELKKAARIYKEARQWDEAFKIFLQLGELEECLKLVDRIKDKELLSKFTLKLIQKDELEKAKEMLKELPPQDKDILEAFILFKEGNIEKAYEIAKNQLKNLKNEFKDVALDIITTYYKKQNKWKEISILLSPLETTKRLDNRKLLLLAEAYLHTEEYLRSIRILNNLMDTEVKREAKGLLKKIKEKTEDEDIIKICEEILSEDSFFKKLREGLSKSRTSIVGQIESLFKSEKPISASTLEELEEILLSADVGVEATQQILKSIKKRIELGEIKSDTALISALEEEILKILKKAEGKLIINAKPFVIMVVGVNGTGKTTSIAKLAYMLKNKGYSVLLAAADTFRAAAIEQLEIWGKRLKVDVIKQKTGSDPSGVVYDALKAAKARGIDVVIIDTAGRLHTKVNLMEELKKLVRISSKEIEGAPHEILLVLDAVVGQNAISQAKMFSEAIPITGIILTKLDGSAKGGIIIAIAKLFNIPIKFIGVGEKLDDLQEFNADRFVSALFEY